MGVRCTCEDGPLLVKKIEDGGLLLRGNAPTIKIKDGRLVIEQKCPKCRRLTTYSPLAITVGKP